MRQHVSGPSDPIRRLFQFGLNTVLPAAPAGMWWAIGLGLFSLLNLLLQQEVWPHTPHIEHWFELLGLLCLVILPWQIGRAASRVANSLPGLFWQFCWRLAAWSAYAAGAVLLIPAGIGLVWLIITKLAV